MAKREEHVKCVLIGESMPEETWCGRLRNRSEWAFADATHAALNGRQMGRLVTCPECAHEIHKALLNGSEQAIEEPQLTKVEAWPVLRYGEGWAIFDFPGGKTLVRNGQQALYFSLLSDKENPARWNIARYVREKIVAEYAKEYPKEPMLPEAEARAFLEKCPLPTAAKVVAEYSRALGDDEVLELHNAIKEDKPIPSFTTQEDEREA